MYQLLGFSLLHSNVYFESLEVKEKLFSRLMLGGNVVTVEALVRVAYTLPLKVAQISCGKLKRFSFGHERVSKSIQKIVTGIAKCY